MDSVELVILIGSLTLFIFGLFLLGFFLFHSRKMRINREKIQSLELARTKKSLIDSIEIQEAERARIGSDIHDDLGPTMSAIKLKINSLSDNKLPSSRDIEQLKEMVNDTIQDLRGLSHSLYPSTLENYGLSNAIYELAQRIHSDRLSVKSNIDEQINNLIFYTQINIYRIIQEFCNNSIKYANCSLIEIEITCHEENVHIALGDNGVGFDIDDEIKSDGIGLRNMKMRADAINYSFDLYSTIGGGTRLVLASQEDEKDNRYMNHQKTGVKISIN